MESNRRSILKAGLAAGLFAPLPWTWVWAQSEGALKLLKAPKVALVVGNGKYKDAPELKNAPNDAKAIAEVLKASGFAVTMLLETNKDALIGAIRSYVNAMEKQKAVGLFYFAGHGVQLDWRNYMLPVDAVIDKVDDVAKESVDIARLMEGLTKAANPMNVIILDACREDPFGKARKPVKGLSQMDAPTNTILAYATSPGNVASDGDGANGLYTENLLREMKVPEAKIEDVFKRVRLGVRRKSNGAQIPWESTSLEEDFWFQPPKELKAASDAERDRLMKEDEAAWEKAQQSKDAKAIEEYLRRFPSGNYSELAQVYLDRALAKEGEKKVQIASAEGNPYSKGTVAIRTDHKVGDSYTFRVVDAYSRVEQRRFTRTVKAITEDEVQFDDNLIQDLLGNNVRMPDGRRVKGAQNYPQELTVGKRWQTRFTTTFPNGSSVATEFNFVIAARENVTVPAGTFHAFRINAVGHSRNPKGEAVLIENHRYLAPDQCRLPLVVHELRRVRGQVMFAERGELVSFKPG
jgi:hypothetical protein